MFSSFHIEAKLSSRSPARTTVLVVEDDEDMGYILLEVLQKWGQNRQPPLQVILTPDSREALELVDTVTPNLLVLDYYLPRMNGLDLYDRLHAMERLEHVPAIFLSANPPMREIAKRHLTSLKKPFNLDELWYAVDSLLPAST